MSAPDTTTDTGTQAARHKAALFGIEGADTQVQPGVGTVSTDN